MASFGPGRQHHEHQLGRLWRHLARQASIMSISWEGCGVIWPGKPASRASAGKVVASFGPASQHHEHQLGRLWRHLARDASIMSISWEGCGVIWPGTPASRASAGKVVASFGPASQHHEHQLGRLWHHLARQASIMSISWEGCGVIWPGKPASCASAGKVVASSGPGRQHHEHQLGRLWRHLARAASIMSISWEGCGVIWPGKPTS